MAFKDEVGSLDRIASAVETISGGKEIPTPTQSDKDKVLSVNAQGKYALATPSGGGGGVFVMGQTVDVETGTMTLDKTFGEIKEAVFTNNMIPALVQSGVTGRNFQLSSGVHAYSEDYSEDGGGEVFFIHVVEGSIVELDYSAAEDSDYPVYTMN